MEREFCGQFDQDDDTTGLEVNIMSPAEAPADIDVNMDTPDPNNNNSTPDISPRDPQPQKHRSGTNANLNAIDKINGRAVKSCYLKISVKDTGIGMTKDEQTRIFRRFSQANNRTSSVLDFYSNAILC